MPWLQNKFSVLRRHRARIGVSVFFVTALVLPFQNCGDSHFQTLDFSTGASQLVDLASTTQTTGSTTTTTQPLMNFLENESSQVLTSSSIEGISEGQIFQRKDSGVASIQLKLKESVAANLPYYSISLLSSVNSRERILASGLRNSQSLFSFELATGLALRKVRLSFHDSRGVEQARWSSPGFAVGEVFLISGQSNSSTHGEGPTSSSNPLNRGVDPVTKTWVPLKDPLPYASNWLMPPWNQTVNPGGSPWPGFADDLSARLQVPVAVISVGWGGSAVSWWVPGYSPDYFSRLVIGAQSVPNCGFRAVLWHQGESDSMGKLAASYPATFLKVVSAFRASTGCQQPWMIAQVSYLHTKYWIQNYNLSEADAEAVKWKAEVDTRKAQKDLAMMSSFRLGPDTDLLVSHQYRFDDLHFSMLGLPLHGKLWSQKVLAMLGKPSLSEQDLIPEVKTVWNLFQNILSRTKTEMENDSEGVRYWVEQLSLGKTTEAALAETLRNSDEYFIRQVYQSSFGRQPTPDELSGWISKLASGAITSRTQLKEAILKSKL